MRRRVQLLICGIALLFLFTACGVRIPRPAGKLMMRVDVNPQANNNNPVAVDLVLVKNKKLLQELMKIKAKDWFENRNQYRLDYPKEIGLNAGSWEWAPGQVVKLDPMTMKARYAGGLIFANYFTPGAHRAVIDPSKPVVLTLGPEEINVVNGK